jgi:hypothetical protein
LAVKYPALTVKLFFSRNAISLRNSLTLCSIASAVVGAPPRPTADWHTSRMPIERSDTLSESVNKDRNFMRLPYHNYCVNKMFPKNRVSLHRQKIS